MNVKELIEALSTLPQDAKVTVYSGYSSVSGDQWNDNFELFQEAVGWDVSKEGTDEDPRTYEIFIQ